MAKVFELLENGFTFAWDISLALLNLIVPKWPQGSLIAKEHGGKWPDYMPPSAGDSRCSCPALNAMANHGILPHDGKNITFKDLAQKVQDTYNFSPSFCFFVPNFAARMLGRKFSKDSFDLADLDLHSAKSIEHDASLLREDRSVEQDQGKIAPHLSKRLLDSATGKNAAGEPILTIPDLSRNLSKRRVESKSSNKEFSMEKTHQFFSSANAATLIRIYGGSVKDLEPILLEERIPDRWESAIRERYGLTMMSFNKTVKKVANEIDEDAAAAELGIELKKSI